MIFGLFGALCGGLEGGDNQGKKDNFSRLPAKELPRGADAPTSSATVADILD